MHNYTRITPEKKMAASSVGLPRPTVGIFRRCVQNICPIFNVPSLRGSQFQALTVSSVARRFL